MVSTVNYVIATYSGVYKETEDKSDVLQQQLEILHRYVLPNDECIKYVTIVCPAPHHERVYMEYYQKERWILLFRAEHPLVDITFIDYVGDNKHHSYDQWLQGYLYRKDADYHIFIEDDYALSADTNAFHVYDAIQLYHRVFPGNIGYLCTLAGTNGGKHYHHAVISNGIVSKQTLEKIPNILDSYYRVAEPYPQLRFSRLFTDNNLDIKDMTSTCKAIFWNSDSSKIEDYTRDRDNLRYFFTPIQHHSTSQRE